MGSYKQDCLFVISPLSVENKDGLCSQLLLPCPKEIQIVPFKELEVERSSIQMTEKLGAGQFGEVWKGEKNVSLANNFLTCY
jgi:hypothetical protein